jgi:uncharacterized protein YdeI (YjbR/CyaY-like superfamily)
VKRRLFFADPAAWRRWLEANHDGVEELWVGFHTRGSGRPSITWPESVDEALCFGWIDGVRKSIDEASYEIRFTPRKAKSGWSSVNLRRIAVLIAEGRVHPAGLAAHSQRDVARSRAYSYEVRASVALEPAFEARLRANAKAWAFWDSKAPGYRKIATFWIVSAKREETREKRLAELIAAAARGRDVGPMLQAKKYRKK